MSGVTSDPAAREKIEKAREYVADLASGKRRWTMSVPARPGEDDDFVLMDALDAGLALLSELATTRQELAEWKAKATGTVTLRSELADTQAELVVVRRQLAEAREALREIFELPRAVLWKAYDVARAVLDAGQDGAA